DVASMFPVKVPVDDVLTVPPIARPQTPPEVSSAFGFGRPATKAFPCARNAVFMVPITEVMAFAVPTTPPTICAWAAAKLLMVAWSTVKLNEHPGVGRFGGGTTCADVPVELATIALNAEPTRKPTRPKRAAPKGTFIAIPPTQKN